MPLKVSDGIGAWIKDFKKSDAPQFKGKSDKERRDQAIAAYLSAKRGKKDEGWVTLMRGPGYKIQKDTDTGARRKVQTEDFTFKVDIDGLPSMFMPGNSPGQVKNHLRKLIKQPSMIKGVERQTKHDVKKMYRKKAQGKDIDEAVDSTDTGGAEEVDMAMKQIKAMRHFLDGIEARVEKTGDMEEWYQNKLTKANDYLKTLYSYGKGDDVNENAISELSPDTVKSYKKAASDSNYRAASKYARIARSPTGKKYKDKEMAKQDDIMRKRKAGLARADNKEDMSGYLKSMGKKPDKSSDVQNYMTLKKMMKKKKTNEGSCGQVDYGSDKSIKIMKKKTPGETNEKITLAKVRGTMYKGAKALGDVQAVRKKKVGKRVARRVAGKVASRVLRNLIK